MPDEGVSSSGCRSTRSILATTEIFWRQVRREFPFATPVERGVMVSEAPLELISVPITDRRKSG